MTYPAGVFPTIPFVDKPFNADCTELGDFKWYFFTNSPEVTFTATSSEAMARTISRWRSVRSANKDW